MYQWVFQDNAIVKAFCISISSGNIVYLSALLQMTKGKVHTGLDHTVDHALALHSFSFSHPLLSLHLISYTSHTQTFTHLDSHCCDFYFNKGRPCLLFAPFGNDSLLQNFLAIQLQLSIFFPSLAMANVIEWTCARTFFQGITRGNVPRWCTEREISLLTH